jgi:hypothetical protein
MIIFISLFSLLCVFGLALAVIRRMNREEREIISRARYNHLCTLMGWESGIITTTRRQY